MQTDIPHNKQRKPEWLKIKLPIGQNFTKIHGIVHEHGLNTICVSGKCPNQGECWGRGTATLMILGEICTRACKFCAVKTGRPLPVNEEEPQNVAKSVHLMKLKHVVITSVDRDDLPDGGADIWKQTILAVKELNPNTSMETLIPDFDGRMHLVDQVIEAAPEVISHNLETVRRLTPLVRSRAKYERSLAVLEFMVQKGVNTKSGIMLGLGETEEEIVETIQDLGKIGVNILTIGQYLQPTSKHLPVEKYVTPEEFAHYKEIALGYGFKHVESGPLVRSSYHAEKHIGKKDII